MTTAEMLAMLRTLLDETPEGFWEDTTDCYPALKEGQLAVVKELAKSKSIALQPLIVPVESTTLTFTASQGIDLPTDFFVIYSLKASPDGTTEYVCKERNGDIFFFEDNPYMSSEDSELYYTITYSDTGGGVDKQLLFEKDFSSGTLSMNYVKKPADISATQDPQVDSIAHQAIVFYAYFTLLVKAKLDNARAFQMYQNVMEGLK